MLTSIERDNTAMLRRR